MFIIRANQSYRIGYVRYCIEKELDKFSFIEVADKKGFPIRIS